ncbi:MAG TPA: putative zinc-binding metallopeptidase [Terriglobales bacterium]|nr:putative zinc-binding metallopeptidase [Terriglobales bacterium]
MITKTSKTPPAQTVRVDTCVCGRPVFFRNSAGVACSANLGYEPLQGVMRVIPPDDPEFRRCANFETPSGCNWLIPASDPSELCIACRVNRTIPDLSVPGNDVKWRRIEDAKRKLVASLMRLGITPKPKSEDPESGLAFDFLADTPNSHILIGHNEGVNHAQYRRGRRLKARGNARILERALSHPPRPPAA